MKRSLRATLVVCLFFSPALGFADPAPFPIPCSGFARIGTDGANGNDATGHGLAYQACFTQVYQGQCYANAYDDCLDAGGVPNPTESRGLVGDLPLGRQNGQPATGYYASCTVNIGCPPQPAPTATPSDETTTDPMASAATPTPSETATPEATPSATCADGTTYCSAPAFGYPISCEADNSFACNSCLSNAIGGCNLSPGCAYDGDYSCTGDIDPTVPVGRFSGYGYCNCI